MERIENLPRVAFGTWSIGGGDSWGKNDERESLSALSAAIDLGFTYFDTAPAYGNGLSERLLGEVIKSRRDKVFVATKCGLEWGESGSILHKERDGVKVWRNLKPDAIKRQVEGSLKRLDTDYIDVLLTHWQCPVDPLEESIRAMEDLRKEGKIRAWGSCNNTPESLVGYFENGQKPILFQERWSLLETANENILKVAEEKGVIFQAYSSMERGLLTGKIKPEDEISGSAKKGDKWFRKKNIVRVNEALAPLLGIAEKNNVPLQVLLSSYALSLSPSFSLVLGARRIEQVVENRSVLTFALSEEDKNEITRLWKQPKAVE
ncbi:MAG: aldo/keto reductase [Spirochaetales bacterium]|nr:aldo/keto reductase [Spirochaetales bacterium]